MLGNKNGDNMKPTEKPLGTLKCALSSRIHESFLEGGEMKHLHGSYL